MADEHDHSDDEPYVTSRPPRLTRVSEGDERDGASDGLLPADGGLFLRRIERRGEGVTGGGKKG